MKRKWMPHIIAGTAFALFVVLGLACATTPMTFEERKAFLLKPEINKFDLELKMADENIPQSEQGFLYCETHGVKDRIFMTYTELMSVVVFPPEKGKKFWVRLEQYDRKLKWEIAVDFEPGQSYWLATPGESTYYSQEKLIVVPVTEEGIAAYTKSMWNWDRGDTMGGNTSAYLSGCTKEEWGTYEAYHQFITQMWEIRKEETKKQLKN